MTANPSPTIDGRPSRGRAVLLTMLLLGGSLALAAAVAEAVLRIYVGLENSTARRLADYDPMNVKLMPFGTVGYKQRPNVVLRYENGTSATANDLGFRGPAIAIPKPAGVTRIVLLGGSTTHGWGVNDDETIDAHMRRELSRLAPGRFEVINAALDGYDSRQLLERFQHDVLRLGPDVVIVNSGINDVRNARYANLVDDDPRTLIWRGPMERLRQEALHGPSLWTRAKHHSLLLRLPGFVASRRKSSIPDTAVTAYPDAANYYERNLRRIVATARANGIRVIFSTPPSSLRTRYAASAPPEKGYWLKDAESTQQYRDTLAARSRKVSAQLSRENEPIPYLRPQVPPEHFLDDAHLTSTGNAIVAAEFARAVLQLINRQSVLVGPSKSS